MSEMMVADRWLYDSLANNEDVSEAAPGGIHADTAPQHTAFPFVVFSLESAHDVRVVNGSRVLTDATYLVKGVTEGSTYKALEAVADAIDAALHNASAVKEDGAIVWCVRERLIRYAQSGDGEEYRHLGAYYRIQVRKE